ncbi:hypothetical protein FLJC2902T_05540 [Flavobacterium limnosediminis JC2902]|uniref:Host attachment protein n=1 Tax=Flavobacterium limnosediminis JC2902 TaxID=1341181 RepID=V6STU7_9FLAO|nr:hypothetical protein [Flavobacterium limnosediminis]ESU30061.1 hypothetical protein FLJC2902T_05540 [Flavobacterium limnosediminis JC2902]
MKKVQQTGIWIDSSRAILVTLEGGKEHITELDSEMENRMYHDHGGNKGAFMGRQHVNDERKFEERRKHQLQDFLEDVVYHTRYTDELYVFGPAETKTALSKLIYEDKTNAAMKLKAVEPADKMSLNKIVARVKKFYLH